MRRQAWITVIWQRFVLMRLRPVIGDVAMETISETVITESTVIGHNPSTPGGTGIGVGTSVLGNRAF